MSNGLDDLANRRKTRRGRQTPPPRHPKPEQPETTEPTSSEPEPRSAPPPEAQPAPAPMPEAKPVRAGRSDATRRTRTPSVEAYLTEDLIDFLWEVESAGVARRERNLTSPVIRLALRELRARMSAEQVVERIIADAPERTGRRGRPRR